jgi:NADP-dependent alcohol dehydrogenase
LGAGNIDAIVKHLESHRMLTLGEQRDVTLEVSRKVLEMSV